MWLLNEVFGGYPIEMNAVFVVNLVTSLGFGVEFCNHIGMSFMRQPGTRQARAMKALAEMGSSVLVGIASTKLLGVIVLAFAPSSIFTLYYFRMYLFIILLGLFNGLCLLPILLRWVGPAPVRHYKLYFYRTCLNSWNTRSTRLSSNKFASRVKRSSE
jgi:Niemann-Pick C1 protein